MICQHCRKVLPEDVELSFTGLARVNGVTTIREFVNHGIAWDTDSSWGEKVECPHCNKYTLLYVEDRDSPNKPCENWDDITEVKDLLNKMDSDFLLNEYLKSLEIESKWYITMQTIGKELTRRGIDIGRRYE